MMELLYTLLKKEDKDYRLFSIKLFLFIYINIKDFFKRIYHIFEKFNY